MNLFTDEMMSDVDVLRSLVKYTVVEYLDCPKSMFSAIRQCIYSASVEDSAMVHCFCVALAMVPSFI